jgi:hypothetical protein
MLPSIERFSQKAPNSPPIAAGLSLVHAFLGEKDAAIKEAERAITLLPSAKDAGAWMSGETLLQLDKRLGGNPKQFARMKQINPHRSQHRNHPIAASLAQERQETSREVTP